MTLAEWAEQNGMTDAAIARAMNDHIGADVASHELRPVSPQAVQKYRAAGQVPTKRRMRALVAVTGGAVTANDFYDLPDQGAA